MNRPPLPYRPNVCMLVYDRRGWLFLGQRAGGDTWQFPQGGVEGSAERSVVRELEEELGLRRSALGRIQRLQATHSYEFATIPSHWRNRWRGQRQSFWAVELVGPDTQIRLDAHPHIELTAWRWCDPIYLLEEVDPVRRAGYEAPLREFQEWLGRR